MRPTLHSLRQLGAAIVLMGLGNGMGCATQGDLETVQQDVRNGLARVRGQEQKLAELRRELKSHEQGKDKDLHEAQMRLADTVRDVQQQLEVLTLSQARMREALKHLEASGPTKERMEGILHAMQVTLVEGLKSERAELKDRLQVLDKALDDLQQPVEHTLTPGRHVPEEPHLR